MTNVFAFPWTRALLDRIFACRGEAFAGELSALYAGDRLAAVHFGMRSYGVLHLWFPSYDADLAKFSPGLIHDLELHQGRGRAGNSPHRLWQRDDRPERVLYVRGKPGCRGQHRLAAAGRDRAAAMAPRL